MTLASDKRAALRFAQRRGFKGDELPKGRQQDSGACPLANALWASVGCGPPWEGEVEIDFEVVRAPAVARFIHNFDEGKYPDLIDESAPAPG